VEHAEEVLDVVLPPDHQPTKVMEPSEKSLDSPTFAVTTLDVLADNNTATYALLLDRLCHRIRAV